MLKTQKAQQNLFSGQVNLEPSFFICFAGQLLKRIS